MMNTIYLKCDPFMVDNLKMDSLVFRMKKVFKVSFNFKINIYFNLL